MSNDKKDTVFHMKDAKLAALKKELSRTPFEEQTETLTQINELVGGEDIDLLLTLAMRNFNFGNDSEALIFLGKAKALAPNNHNVLRVRLFMSAALGARDSIEIADQLLASYPDDFWAKSIKEKLICEDTTSLSMPPLDNSWEYL